MCRAKRLAERSGQTPVLCFAGCRFGVESCQLRPSTAHNSNPVDHRPWAYEARAARTSSGARLMGNDRHVDQGQGPAQVKGATSTAPIYRGLAAKRPDPQGLPQRRRRHRRRLPLESRASAEAWFTEDRMVELTKRFGVRPRLTWYDTHVTVDNLKGETRVDGKALVDAH